jgi:hypothetical protein
VTALLSLLCSATSTLSKPTSPSLSHNFYCTSSATVKTWLEMQNT